MLRLPTRGSFAANHCPDAVTIGERGDEAGITKTCSDIAASPQEHCNIGIHPFDGSPYLLTSAVSILYYHDRVDVT